MKRIEFFQSAISQSEALDHCKSDQMFDLIAQYWSIYLTKELGQEFELCSLDIPAMVALMKMAHAQVLPAKEVFVESLAYIAIAGEMYHKHSTSTPDQ